MLWETLSLVPPVESTMSRDHPDGRTTPAEPSRQTLTIPRWAGIAAALVLLLPVLFMSTMMLVVGWFGPPLPGGMAPFDPGLFRLVGSIPVLLVLGVLYGVYRLAAAHPE